MPTTIPSSDATLAAAPQYIPTDEPWDDPEWRAAAAKPLGERTEEEVYLFAGGPRPHPWGFVVFSGLLPDGRTAYFPNKAAYDAFLGAQTHQNAQPTLAALARGLSAQGKVAADLEASKARESEGITNDSPPVDSDIQPGGRPPRTPETIAPDA